jgi:hypothetical protein
LHPTDFSECAAKAEAMASRYGPVPRRPPVPPEFFKAMTDIIAGRVMKNRKDEESGLQVDMSAAEVMADAIYSMLPN